MWICIIAAFSHKLISSVNCDHSMKVLWKTLRKEWNMKRISTKRAVIYITVRLFRGCRIGEKRSWTEKLSKGARWSTAFHLFSFRRQTTNLRSSTQNELRTWFVNGNCSSHGSTVLSLTMCRWFTVPLWRPGCSRGCRRGRLLKAAGSCQLSQSVEYGRRRLGAERLGRGDVCLQLFQVAFQLGASVLEPRDDLGGRQMQRRRDVVAVCRREVLLTSETSLQFSQLLVRECRPRLSSLTTRSKALRSSHRHQLLLLLLV